MQRAKRDGFGPVPGLKSVHPAPGRGALLVCALALGVLAPAVGLKAAEPAAIAVFDFELLDTSLEGEVQGISAEESQRLALVSNLVREKLAESGRYRVVDLASAAQAIEEVGHLHGCNGCEAAIARGAKAELALTGVVQKVSNLILNINIYLRDATSGELLRVMSADIRGNTDQSWSRGTSWLVRNRFLKE